MDSTAASSVGSKRYVSSLVRRNDTVLKPDPAALPRAGRQLHARADDPGFAFHRRKEPKAHDWMHLDSVSVKAKPEDLVSVARASFTGHGHQPRVLYKKGGVVAGAVDAPSRPAPFSGNICGLGRGVKLIDDTDEWATEKAAKIDRTALADRKSGALPDVPPPRRVLGAEKRSVWATEHQYTVGTGAWKSEAKDKTGLPECFDRAKENAVDRQLKLVAKRTTVEKNNFAHS